MSLFGRLKDIQNGITNGKTVRIGGRDFKLGGDPWADYPPNEASYEIPPLDVVRREDWLALEPLPTGRSEDLVQPARSVQIVYDTETDSCETRDDCLDIVSELQKLHMNVDGYEDINFNFLIGGDGAVYEGRGWAKKVQHNPQWQDDITNSCVVGLIGNYQQQGPPDGMMNTFELFVHKFVSENKLDRNCTAIKIYRDWFPLVRRESWGALPFTGRLLEIILPLDKIIVEHNTNTEPCGTPDECKSAVLAIQKTHQSKLNMSDINYNFLIGGDGNVYEGRGWNYRPQKFFEDHKFTPFSLSVALIGKYSHSEQIPDIMKTALDRFIDNSKECKYLKDSLFYFEAFS